MEKNDEVPVLTFNSLYNILREEKKIQLLHKIDPIFYTLVKNFLSEKKKLVKKFQEQKDLENLNKQKHILKNSKKIIEEFLIIRISKILNMTLKNNIYKKEIVSNENILEEEKVFIHNLDLTINGFRETLK